MSMSEQLVRRVPEVRPKRRMTLRAQFTLIIFLLTFLPNLILSLSGRYSLPWTVFMVWMVLVAILCGMVGFLLSGAMLRPLHRLESELQEGQIVSVQPDDPEEVASLRGAFSDLLGRLSTEQARRNAFMATLVHDLKTPLIATGHLTRVLTEMPVSEQERREIGTQLLGENGRLLALVQQMADAHRFEREDVRLSAVELELGDLLRSVLPRFEAQAKAHGIALSIAGERRALADAAALERAISNLTDNALRYAKSYVQLRVTERGVEVADDGPGLGVPLDELAQPFNAQPALIAGQHYTSGTAGLGLYIVRRITEAHGGQLTYERRKVGQHEETVMTIHLAQEDTP